MSGAPLRALLVDDEPLALLELRRLLVAHSDVVEVVGEARNAAAARRAIEALRPNALFLDIHLPDGDGLSLLASLESPPRTVFVTAYDEHAVRAFELNALDYLVKPVDPRRLTSAIERLVPSLREDDASDHERAETPTGRLAMSDRIFLRDGDRAWFVTVAELRLLEVHGESTRVHFGRGNAVVPRAVRAIEGRLPPRGFVRANRAQVVGVTWIRDVTPWFAGRLKLRLDGGQEVLVSRRQARAFATELGL